MVHNYLDREIGLEQILGEALVYPPSRNQQVWDKFHLDYVTQVGKIVGFKRPAQTKDKLTKLERKVFERIFKEYSNQQILQGLFGSYENFFYCFFVNPYNISYSSGTFADVVISLEQALEQSDSDVQKNELREEKEIIQFVRGLNLPSLVFLALESYPRKNLSYKLKKEKEITYETKEGKTVNTLLKVDFASSLWEDVFSSGDDCIFLTLTLGANDKLDLKMQKFWFASLLHSVHPNIDYINFRTPSADVPNPLFRVKIMKAEDEKKNCYLIVGGVLGENIRRIKTKGIEEFIDDSIREFFVKNYGKKDRLFYNFNHVLGEERPYNQFVDFIKKKYSINENKLKTVKEVNKIRCTHLFHVDGKQSPIHLISNSDEEGSDVYEGEQYSETFQSNQPKGKVGAFTLLGGGVKGFDLSYRKTKSSKLNKYIRNTLLGLGIGLGIIISYASINKYYSVVSDQETRTKNYLFYRAYVVHDPNGESILTGEDAIKKVIIRPTKVEEAEREYNNWTEDKVIKELNGNLRLYCDRIEPFNEVDEKELQEKGIRNRNAFIPGGVDTRVKDNYTLVCPTDVVSIIYNTTFFEQREFSDDDQFESLQIPLSDISQIRAVLEEGKANFRIRIPFLYEPALVDNFNPAIEISTFDGKQYLLSGNGRLSFPGRAILVPEIIDLINRILDLQKIKK